MKSGTKWFLITSVIYHIIALFVVYWAFLIANVMLFANDPAFWDAFAVALINIVILSIPNLLAFLTAYLVNRNKEDKPTWKSFFIVEGVMVAVVLIVLLVL